MRDDVQCSLVDDSACLPIERRRAPRLRADIIGTIRLSGQHPEKCLIADMSASGARIRRFFAGDLPLFLNIEIADGIVVPARIAWEKGNSLGVKFIHTIRSARPSAGCAIA